MRLDLGYKIVVRNFFVAQTQAEQSHFPTTKPTTKTTHLYQILSMPSLAPTCGLPKGDLLACSESLKLEYANQ